MYTLPGMSPSTCVVSYRIRTDIAGRVEDLSKLRGITESRLIEELLVEAARAAKLDTVDPDDPNSALDELLEEVKQLITPRRGAGVLNESVILEVFNQIKLSPALSKLHDAAIVPPTPSGLTAESRRQFVHQRVARFVKTFLGMRSIGEVTLPRGSEALIRSYTKLG
jgi:hypothetical protein